ncbi:MAG: hypothetical protein J6A15_08120 [Clostridia bacterium]|nr:hypothetical protein [Clostridia bacterium]
MENNKKIVILLLIVIVILGIIFVIKSNKKEDVLNNSNQIEMNVKPSGEPNQNFIEKMREKELNSIRKDVENIESI